MLHKHELHSRCCFFFASRRRHTRLQGDWSSHVCSSDLSRRPALSGADPHRALARSARGGGMKTGLSQHTSLRQELRVNPRLYQAMDMLYMPMMDLQQHLKQELLSNPFLELLEPEEETPEQKDSEQEKEQKEKEEEMDWEEILLNGFEVGGTREQFEQLEYTEPVTVETKDLIDHLREQLQMLTLTPRQLLLAEEFLDRQSVV